MVVTVSQDSTVLLLLLTWDGKDTIPGTRCPPSYISRFRPRNGPADPGASIGLCGFVLAFLHIPVGRQFFSGPLSVVNQV